jgi:hypothetical protein
VVDRNLNPKDLSSEELDERYRSTWHSAVGNFNFDAEASLLSIEINRRFIEESTQENIKLSAENHLLSIENNKLSKRGVAISFLALFIALTSAVFSFVDWKEDGVWQFEQIRELSQIVGQLKESNQLMVKQLELSKTQDITKHLTELKESVRKIEHSNMLLAKKVSMKEVKQ